MFERALVGDRAQASEALSSTYDYRDGDADALRPWRMTFQPVPQRLKLFVEAIFSYPVPDGRNTFSRFPEGIVHIVCLMTGGTQRITPSRPFAGRAALLVSGPHAVKHPMLVGSETIVAQLRPGAARAVLGLPADTIRGEVVPADAIWGAAANEVVQRIEGAPSVVTRLEALTSFLQGRLDGAATDDLFALRAADWMQRQPASARLLERLATQSGYSERQTRRKFDEALGMSPKAYARTLRLLSVLRLGKHDTHWGELAAATGYYDQSHLVNDFRAATGLPPASFFKRPELTALSGFGILQEVE